VDCSGIKGLYGMMDSHLERKAPGVAPDAPKTDSAEARERALARRRRFLMAGLSSAPLIATLANRSALATTTRACTISAWHSANASRPVTGRCGVSPGCWGQHALTNNAAAWTAAGFSPSQLFTSVFPMLKTSPWSVYPSNVTMLSAIKGGAIIKLKLVDGSKTVTIDNFAAAFPLQICAAVLNAGYFGTPAYPLTIQQVKDRIIAITSKTTTGDGATSQTTQSAFKNAISSLTSELDAYNNLSNDCPTGAGV
jgi:hypothetical protein